MPYNATCCSFSTAFIAFSIFFCSIPFSDFFSFHPNEGKEEHYNLNGARPRQAAEFEAFYRAMTAGNQELCARMLDTSIAVSRVLTVARRSAGVRFPGDRF